MKVLLGKLTYANVMATIAVFIALGGASYAATQLQKNSVGTKQLKKSAVTGAKVKDQSLTGKDIKVSSLGRVPDASHATTADTASHLSPAEPIHLIGTPGEPGFQNGAVSNKPELGLNFPPVGFYKDREGVVHLEGSVQIPEDKATVVFTLPPGFRPPEGITQGFIVGDASVLIAGAGVNVTNLVSEGGVLVLNNQGAALSGITYRAGS